MIKYEVYILLLSNNQYYIGSTIDLQRRLEEHNTGKTISIKNKLPAKLVFHQEYSSIKEARQVEYRLKKKKSRYIIEQIIENGAIKIK